LQSCHRMAEQEAENLQSSADADMVATKTEPGRTRSTSAKRPAVGDPPLDDGFLPEGLTNHDIEVKLNRVVEDLEMEIGKRRDLRDELDRQAERLTETRQLSRNNMKAIQQCISILGAEGEHLDSVRVLTIKKQGCTMRSLPGLSTFPAA
jgi:hypothetical protein